MKYRQLHNSLIFFILYTECLENIAQGYSVGENKKREKVGIIICPEMLGFVPFTKNLISLGIETILSSNVVYIFCYPSTVTFFYIFSKWWLFTIFNVKEIKSNKTY